MMLMALLLATTLSSLDSYVVLMPHNHLIENGSYTLAELDAIREAYGDHVFIFRKDGRDYVVRDAGTLRAIEDLFEPQTELGAKQSALGRQQSELGARQSKLGAEQGRIGAQQARASEGERNDLARQQEELSRQQSELGRQQAVLGREQSRLGAQQAEIARKAERTLGAMVDDLIRRGIARPLHR